MGVLAREQREQEVENLFEKIMKENFPILVKEIDIQVQETQSLKQVGPKEDHTKTHLIKMPVVKERISKATREKRVTYKGVPLRLSNDFSKETLQAKRDCKKYSK